MTCLSAPASQSHGEIEINKRRQRWLNKWANVWWPMRVGHGRRKSQWNALEGVVLALEQALENTDPLCGWAGAAVVCHSGIPAPPSSWSPWITRPFTELTGKGGLVQCVIFILFFFYIPLFAFQLIEQMEILLLNYPVSPFDPSTSGRRFLNTFVF